MSTKAQALRDAIGSLKKKSMNSILITVGAHPDMDDEGHGEEAETLAEADKEYTKKRGLAHPDAGGPYTKKRGLDRMTDQDARKIAKKLMG